MKSRCRLTGSIWPGSSDRHRNHSGCSTADRPPESNRTRPSAGRTAQERASLIIVIPTSCVMVRPSDSASSREVWHTLSTCSMQAAREGAGPPRRAAPTSRRVRRRCPTRQLHRRGRRARHEPTGGHPPDPRAGAGARRRPVRPHREPQRAHRHRPPPVGPRRSRLRHHRRWARRARRPTPTRSCSLPTRASRSSGSCRASTGCATRWAHASSGSGCSTATTSSRTASTMRRSAWATARSPGSRAGCCSPRWWCRWRRRRSRSPTASTPAARRPPCSTCRSSTWTTVTGRG